MMTYYNPDLHGILKDTLFKLFWMKWYDIYYNNKYIAHRIYVDLEYVNVLPYILTSKE